MRAMITDAGACGRRHGVGVAYGYADIPTTAISETQICGYDLTAVYGCRFFRRDDMRGGRSVERADGVNGPARLMTTAPREASP